MQLFIYMLNYYLFVLICAFNDLNFNNSGRGKGEDIILLEHRKF